MRLYKFLNGKYGLEAIFNKRLKISIITNLNDPFDFLGHDLSYPKVTDLLTGTMDNASNDFGLISFSMHSNNPLLWSHYSDNHKGICLGFDVLGITDINKVDYLDKRIELPDFLIEFGESDKNKKEFKINKENQKKLESFMGDLMRFKYKNWEYENEYRAFPSINDPDIDEISYSDDKILFFKKFSEELVLKEVIIGVKSEIDESAIGNFLKKFQKEVGLFRAFCPENNQFLLDKKPV